MRLVARRQIFQYFFSHVIIKGMRSLQKQLIKQVFVILAQFIYPSTTEDEFQGYSMQNKNRFIRIFDEDMVPNSLKVPTASYRPRSGWLSTMFPPPSYSEPLSRSPPFQQKRGNVECHQMPRSSPPKQRQFFRERDGTSL